jgi:hypothetical protein
MKCSLCNEEGHNKRSCRPKLKPTTFDGYWLYYGDLSGECDGKWMLFYDKEVIDNKWEELKMLYDSDKLTGIVAMKVSGGLDNPRASTKQSVIILYCGGNEESILEYGRNLLKYLNDYDGDTIYYKTDLQTRIGTKATGISKNSTYQLKIPSRCIIIDDV